MPRFAFGAKCGGRGASGFAARPAADPASPAARVELEVLKLAVQRPALLGPEFDALGPDTFTVPEYRAAYEHIAAAGGTAAAGPGGQPWVDRLLAATADERLRARYDEAHQRYREAQRVLGPLFA